MTYISIQEYLQFAGLTSLDAATSTRVSLLLDSTQETLNHLIGDLTYGQKSEEIRICDIHNGRIQLVNLNISSVDEINGNSFTGIVNVDYQIQPPKNSGLDFRNIGSYLGGLMFPYFNIKYTSGYSTIPDDIKYLQYLMVSGELLKEGGKEVKSYSLGPRSVTFADDISGNSAQKIISNYSIPYV